MAFSHALVSSVLVSGAVFAAAALPLSMFGSQPITLKLEEKPVFSGRVDELATPYLSLATALSLGLGAATFGLLAWQASSRKLSHSEAQIAALKQQLQEKAALLEYFKYSEAKLQTAGLDLFLDADASYQPRQHPVIQERQPQVTSIAVDRHANPPIAMNAHLEEFMQTTKPTPEQNAYNLHDATQVQALVIHLRQIMQQLEKLQPHASAQQPVHNRLIHGSGTAM